MTIHLLDFVFWIILLLMTWGIFIWISDGETSEGLGALLIYTILIFLSIVYFIIFGLIDYNIIDFIGPIKGTIIGVDFVL